METTLPLALLPLEYGQYFPMGLTSTALMHYALYLVFSFGVSASDMGIKLNSTLRPDWNVWSKEHISPAKLRLLMSTNSGSQTPSNSESLLTPTIPSVFQNAISLTTTAIPPSVLRQFTTTASPFISPNITLGQNKDMAFAGDLLTTASTPVITDHSPDMDVPADSATPSSSSSSSHGVYTVNHFIVTAAPKENFEDLRMRNSTASGQSTTSFPEVFLERAALKNASNKFEEPIDGPIPNSASGSAPSIKPLPTSETTPQVISTRITPPETRTEEMIKPTEVPPTTIGIKTTSGPAIKSTTNSSPTTELHTKSLISKIKETTKPKADPSTSGSLFETTKNIQSQSTDRELLRDTTQIISSRKPLLNLLTVAPKHAIKTTESNIPSEPVTPISDSLLTETPEKSSLSVATTENPRSTNAGFQAITRIATSATIEPLEKQDTETSTARSSTTDIVTEPTKTNSRVAAVTEPTITTKSHTKVAGINPVTAMPTTKVSVTESRKTLSTTVVVADRTTTTKSGTKVAVTEPTSTTTPSTKIAVTEPATTRKSSTTEATTVPATTAIEPATTATVPATTATVPATTATVPAMSATELASITTPSAKATVTEPIKTTTSTVSIAVTEPVTMTTHSTKVAVTETVITTSPTAAVSEPTTTTKSIMTEAVTESITTTSPSTKIAVTEPATTTKPVTTLAATQLATATTPATTETVTERTTPAEPRTTEAVTESTPIVELDPALNGIEAPSNPTISRLPLSTHHTNDAHLSSTVTTTEMKPSTRVNLPSEIISPSVASVTTQEKTLGKSESMTVPQAKKNLFGSTRLATTEIPSTTFGGIASESKTEFLTTEAITSTANPGSISLLSLPSKMTPIPSTARTRTQSEAIKGQTSKTLLTTSESPASRLSTEISGGLEQSFSNIPTLHGIRLLFTERNVGPSLSTAQPNESSSKGKVTDSSSTGNTVTMEPEAKMEDQTRTSVASSEPWVTTETPEMDSLANRQSTISQKDNLATINIQTTSDTSVSDTTEALSIPTEATSASISTLAASGPIHVPSDATPAPSISTLAATGPTLTLSADSSPTLALSTLTPVATSPTPVTLFRDKVDAANGEIGPDDASDSTVTTPRLSTLETSVPKSLTQNASPATSAPIGVTENITPSLNPGNVDIFTEMSSTVKSSIFTSITKSDEATKTATESPSNQKTTPTEATITENTGEALTTANSLIITAKTLDVPTTKEQNIFVTDIVLPDRLKEPSSTMSVQSRTGSINENLATPANQITDKEIESSTVNAENLSRLMSTKSSTIPESSKSLAGNLETTPAGPVFESSTKSEDERTTETTSTIATDQASRVTIPKIISTEVNPTYGFVVTETSTEIKPLVETETSSSVQLSTHPETSPGHINSNTERFITDSPSDISTMSSSDAPKRTSTPAGLFSVITGQHYGTTRSNVEDSTEGIEIATKSLELGHLSSVTTGTAELTTPAAGTAAPITTATTIDLATTTAVPTTAFITNAPTTATTKTTRATTATETTTPTAATEATRATETTRATAATETTRATAATEATTPTAATEATRATATIETTTPTTATETIRATAITVTTEATTATVTTTGASSTAVPIITTKATAAPVLTTTPLAKTTAAPTTTTTLPTMTPTTTTSATPTRTTLTLTSTPTAKTTTPVTTTESTILTTTTNAPTVDTSTARKTPVTAVLTPMTTGAQSPTITVTSIKVKPVPTTKSTTGHPVTLTARPLPGKQTTDSVSMEAIATTFSTLATSINTLVTSVDKSTPAAEMQHKSLHVIANFTIFKGINWTEQLTNTSSKEYTQLDNKLRSLLSKLWKKFPLGKFQRISAMRFSKGSVIVQYEAEFLISSGQKLSAKDFTNFFKDSFSKGTKFGNFTILPKSVKHTILLTAHAKEEKSIPNWGVAVIVCGCVVLLFILFMVCVLWSRRHIRQKFRIPEDPEDMGYRRNWLSVPPYTSTDCMYAYENRGVVPDYKEEICKDSDLAVKCIHPEGPHSDYSSSNGMDINSIEGSTLPANDKSISCRNTAEFVKISLDELEGEKKNDSDKFEIENVLDIFDTWM